MDIIVIVISLVSLIVSVLVAMSERRISSKANTLVVVDLLREHGQPSFVETRFYIMRPGCGFISGDTGDSGRQADAGRRTFGFL